MVLAVIAVYVFCWSPYYIFQAVLLYGHSPPDWTRLFFQFLTVLTYSNSAFNPLLYAFLSNNFRQSFLTTVRCRRLPSKQGEQQSNFGKDGMTSFTARKSTVGGMGDDRSTTAAFLSIKDTMAMKLSKDGQRTVKEINDVTPDT